MKKQVHYHNGEIHREKGPAVIEYEADGVTIRMKAYYQQGRKHRRHFPAVIVYSNGEVIHREYWEYGKQIEESESNKAVPDFFQKLLGIDLGDLMDNQPE